MTPCVNHAETIAAWRCDACSKHLCGECTASAGSLIHCTLCDGNATRIVVDRRERSYTSWLIGRYALPQVAVLGAIAAVLLGIAGFVFREMGDDFVGWSAGVRSLIAMLFAILVVDAAARGEIAERGFPVRLLRAVLATMILWLPLAGYAYFLGAPTKHDWTIVMLVALAAIYLPIVLAVAVTDASLDAAMNPFIVFELAWHLGKRYAVAFVCVLLLAALAIGGGPRAAASLAKSMQAPLVGDVAVALPIALLAGLALRAIGLVVYLYGDALGFGPAESYCDPLVPDATARGRRKDAKVLTTEALTKASNPEHVEIRKIVDFLKAESSARAIKAYQARESWSDNAFDARQLLLLGKAAQRMKATELAQQLFAKVIEKFPNTDAAKAAQKAIA